MKAREIKKKMLAEYNKAIAEYDKTLEIQSLRLTSDKVNIRVLEEQLSMFFGIEKSFGFTDEFK